MTIVECGTFAGWRKHKRDGTLPCQACVVANQEFNRLQHAQRMASRNADQHRLYQRVHNKAMRKLRDKHREEFDKIVARLTREERKRANEL